MKPPSIFARLRPTIVFSLLALLSLTVTGCNDTPRLPPLGQDAVILAFGDSLTYGTGARRGEDYPAILAGLTAREVINAGVPGELSASGLQRLPRLLDEYRPELLVLVHGGNDLLRNHSEVNTRANLEAMIELARERGIGVVMLGVPQPGLFLLSSAELYEEVADQAGIPVDLDVLPTILGDNSLKSDLVHPNGDGYRIMAHSLHELLRESGAL